MSIVETCSLDSIQEEPWRNGGGVTRTIAREESEWRVSIAEVQRDGPYSRFEGLSRVSFVLRGKGVVLRDAGKSIELRPRQAAGYDGDRSWEASLIDGPIGALNVMSKAGRYRVNVTSVTSSVFVEPGRVAIVLALETGCQLTVQPNETRELKPGNAAILRKIEAPLLLAPLRNDTSADDEPGLPVVVTIEPIQG
jgi:environmental stress-induced protein Ves